MRFATLGPAGSNHALVLRRYVERRGYQGARIQLFETFDAAFAALLEGRVDRLLQCTAHFSHAEWVGRSMHRAFPVDAFVAASRPLALLARHEVATPRCVGLQPATRHYTDLSRFAEQRELPTIVDVAEALLAGELDAGLCARDLLDRYPGRFRLLDDLGPARDVWVLYATAPLPEGSPLLLV